MNMEYRDDFSTLIRKACSRMDKADSTLEDRIMLAAMNRVVANARRRNRTSFILSLGAATALFACVVFLIMHFLPARIFVSNTLNFDALLDKLPVLSFSTPAVEWLHDSGMFPMFLLTVTITVMVALCWSISRTFYK